MTENSNAPEISMSNTKKEMFEAYQEMKDLLEAQTGAVAMAEQEKEKLRHQAAAAAAERAESEDPIRRLHGLRSDISRQLTDLAGGFERETEEYSRLKQAVSDKKSELARTYQVETAASDLTALIEANRITRQELENELGEKKLSFHQEMETVSNAWEREKREVIEKRQEESTRQEKERQREQDEYDYKLKREREQRRNQLEDEMTALQREISSQRQQLQQEKAEQEAVLKTREDAVAEREQRMQELQQAVDQFPTKLESEVEQAVNQTTERLQAEYSNREALLKKEAEGERNVLKGKIESLEQTVKDQAKRIDALTVQQEKAYEKVQDIANKAVSSAGDRYSQRYAPEPRGSSSREDERA